MKWLITLAATVLAAAAYLLPQVYAPDTRFPFTPIYPQVDGRPCYGGKFCFKTDAEYNAWSTNAPPNKSSPDTP